MNVDTAKDVGPEVVDRMIDQTSDQYSFKSSREAVTLSVPQLYSLEKPCS